ncbi:MAG: energy transducer TonB [Blastocatellia bacterium]|nr:energy transducer TonB [Blastocatellia bacterium]
MRERRRAGSHVARWVILSGLLSGAFDPAWAAQARVAERLRLGANVTMVVYEASGRTASPNPEPVRLAQTFDSLDAEMTYLRKTLGIEPLIPRHIRSIGLLPGERFREGLFLEGRSAEGGRRPIEETMDALTLRVLWRAIELVAVSRANVSMNFEMTHGERTILRLEDVEVRHFETIVLEGALSATGDQPRAVLMTVTVAIVPQAQLRNRPQELSAPCDEYGRAIALRPDDVFLPPVLIERVVPKFPTRRPLGTVLVEGIVTLDGRVTNARLVRAFDRDLETFALEAFERFRFLPARLNGRPVRATIREEVTFQTTP